jgi:N-terminal acetyltransferase B complex non-catalytic subunit
MSSLTLERQIRPIYGVSALFSSPSTSPQYRRLDALDSGSHKSALVTCNKLLKKHPKNDHLKVLALPLSVPCQFSYTI